MGHQVCVSPTVNHRLYDTWEHRAEFKPDRYLNDNPAAGEKFAYVPFGAGKAKKKFCKCILLDVDQRLIRDIQVNYFID